MALALRFTGWALFIIGIATFAYVGAFSAIRDPDKTKQVLAYVGMFGALFGMVLTSTSRLLLHFRYVRHLKEKARKKRSVSPPVVKEQSDPS